MPAMLNNVYNGVEVPTVLSFQGQKEELNMYSCQHDTLKSYNELWMRSS